MLIAHGNVERHLFVFFLKKNENSIILVIFDL